MDADTHIVVAALVTKQPVDVEQLRELSLQTIRNTGRTPKRFLADAGYYSDDNVQHVQDLGAEALIPPQKLRHSEGREQVAPTGRIPAGLGRAERMRRRLETKAGKRLYVQRQASVEPVFGTTRAARGLQQFHHRGLETNHHLWRFDLAVHNLRKIITRLRDAITPPAPPGGRRRATNRNPSTAGAPRRPDHQNGHHPAIRAGTNSCRWPASSPVTSLAVSPAEAERSHGDVTTRHVMRP